MIHFSFPTVTMALRPNILSMTRAASFWWQRAAFLMSEIISFILRVSMFTMSLRMCRMRVLKVPEGGRAWA